MLKKWLRKVKNIWAVIVVSICSLHFVKHFCSLFSYTNILFLNKESCFSAAKKATEKNAKWSLVSILLMVILHVVWPVPIIGAVCSSLRKILWRRPSSYNFYFGFLFIVFVNILRSWRLPSNQKGSVRYCCKAKSVRRTVVCQSLLSLIKTGHDWAKKMCLINGVNGVFCQDGRTALSVAVTCESESAAKLVTLLIGIIVPTTSFIPAFLVLYYQSGKDINWGCGSPSGSAWICIKFAGSGSYFKSWIRIWIRIQIRSTRFKIKREVKAPF